MEEAQGRVGDKLTDDAASNVTDVETEGEDKAPSTQIDPSLMEEASALIDNARTYAEAELGFQKTRAAFAGRKSFRWSSHVRGVLGISRWEISCYEYACR